MKVWSDPSILQSVPNTCPAHHHIMKCPELTFYGFPEQPDCGTVTVDMVPTDMTIELKSLKNYFKQFRNMHISYERILNTIFEDLSTIYKPRYLEVTIDMQPRGGISSILHKQVMWVGRK